MPNVPIHTAWLAMRLSSIISERIHDAFYAARSLAVVQHILEDPTRYLGAPEAEPAYTVGTAHVEAVAGSP